MAKKKNYTEITTSGLETHSQGYIQLPFNEDGFKEFITGLLGKPQTVNANLHGDFNIELKHIEQLYTLINQRVTQQNEASLIQYTARIIFKDDSSVLLNSFEDFITYNEIKPLVSSEVHLTFLYLIKFRDKNVPEKQEINISILGSRPTTDSDKEYNGYTIYASEAARARTRNRDRGLIQYEIKHTARTWASDLDALLHNYFTSLFEIPDRFTKFINAYPFLLSLSISIALFYPIYKFIEKIRLEKRLEHLSEINKVFSQKPLSLQHINNEIKYLVISDIREKDFESYWIIYTILFFVWFFIFMTILQNENKKSFVLLTSESYKAQKKYEKDTKSRLSLLIWTVAINIILSIVANFIYDYFK